MTTERKQLVLAWYGLLSPQDVDGIWGPQSAAATRKLQKALGIEVDGFFGMHTEVEAMKAMMNGWKMPVAEDEEHALSGDFWPEIEHYDPSEFACTCGGRGCNGFPVEPVERLVRNAEDARNHFGRVAIVSSGVRCKLRNSELQGSATNSLHMRGKAMDFSIQGVSAATLLAYVKTLPEVDEAYAIDGSFVHMGVQEYT